MKSLNNLLIISKNKKFFNLEIKRYLIKIIEDKFKIKLSTQDIVIDGLNLKIKTNPALKAKIIINKQEILTILKNSLNHNFKNLI